MVAAMVFSHLKTYVLCLFFTLPLVAYTQSIASHDLDKDGISDQLEQALLDKFRPAFMVSADDCDLLPSEFASGPNRPVALERNGTIYGQVFRPTGVEPGNGVLEIHYYHLWSKDCGRLGHPLDAEYVALLAHADHPNDAAGNWKASYWYAAAHENTLCDRSTIAQASALKAEEAGPKVWISWGKHGSYFYPEQCDGGCGQDRCVAFMPLESGPIMNLGEIDAPMKGAEWTSLAGWNLTWKMSSAFSPEVVAGMEKPESPLPVFTRTGLEEIQAVVLALGASLDSAELGPEEASTARELAETRTREAVVLGLKKARSSIRKARLRFMEWAKKRGLR
jgi:hypothetical protein